MKILIVDDNAEDLYLNEFNLKRRGHEVISAEDGVEALEKLKNHDFDMIISDILMPKMDGFQLCMECKNNKSFKKIPFVFYTATYTDKKDEKFAMNLGASKFIIKPVEPEEFMDILKSVIDEHRERILEAPEKPLIKKTAYLEEYNRELVKMLERKMQEMGNVNGKLRQSESKYKKMSHDFHTLLNAIDEPLIQLSPELKILWANSGASNVFRKETSGLTGQYCYKLWLDRTSPCEGCPTLESFRTGKKGRIQFSTENNLFWEVNSFPVKDEKESVDKVIIVAHDKTSELIYQAETIRAGQLAEMGTLAASLAHEINNPIYGVISCAQLLQDEHGNKNINDIVSRIIKESRRIADVVKSFLSFARESEADKGYFSINELMSDMLMLTSAQMKKDGINVKMRIPPDLPNVYAHPQRIQQVFLNLMNNSLYSLNKKYPGTHKNKIIKFAGKSLMINDLPYIQVTVEDMGAGIPTDKIEKVMDPFFTTKPRGKGTGLGMNISRDIIKEHGGSLLINSVEGKFTKVIINLPVAGEDEG